jgi:ubiquinone/menaquinone biosynthesis C-methylase UbiE
MPDEMADTRRTVDQARESFGHVLFDDDYNRMIADAGHLAHLLALCPTVPGKRYLDLGTGRGYVAFALADSSPGIFVTGIDIVGSAIAANQRRVAAGGCARVDFVTYGGTCLPFADQQFHGVVARYAFHHLPCRELSVAEIRRVLEAGGWCVLADAVTDPADGDGFANRFAALQADGHVRYHCEAALRELFGTPGFTASACSHSAITFSRSADPRYHRLLAATSRRVQDLYGIRVDGDRVYATLPVANLRFGKLAAVCGPT